MSRHCHKLFLTGTYLLVAIVILARVIVENDNYVIPNYNRKHPKLLRQTQKMLQNVIRRRYLTSYRENLPTNYSPSSKTFNSESLNNSLTLQVAEILNFTRRGFFVEYSLTDGIDDSNTVLLERDFDWTGLLIQAPPKLKKVNFLIRRNRRAWVGDFCLSITPYPSTALAFLSGKNSKAKLNMSCFPLEMALASLKRTEVDYLSLNSKGITNEMDIVASFPFDKIRVKVLTVAENRNNRRAIKWFLEYKGFQKIKIKDKNFNNLTQQSFGLYKNLMKSKKVKKKMTINRTKTKSYRTL